ncbi:MAG TPA: hypothetical protein PKY59_20710 [Pyrinomonadaceae bacterium]|nr:hypothetical protein [Pyrinomonadaceae bacterium]
MGSTKHEKSFVDFDKPYEQNVIGLSGIVYFTIGLVFLIVVAFGLMWALKSVLEDYAVEKDKTNANPLMLKDTERLPPEPRLQAAPGFGVDGPNGRVNLELNIPQAEYRTLQGIWNKELAEGQKGANGAVVTLPINEAKTKLLEGNAAPASGAKDDTFKNSQMILSDSSAGRLSSEKRR